MVLPQTCLSKAVATFPDWQVAVIAQIRAALTLRVAPTQERLEALPGKINTAEALVTQAESRVKDHEEALKRSLEDRERPQTEVAESSKWVLTPDPEKKIREFDSVNLRARIREIQDKIDSLRKDLEGDRTTAEEARKKAVQLRSGQPKEEAEAKKALNELFGLLVETIAERTKLSPLLRGLHIDPQGTGVEELMKNRAIHWERLGEDDVTVLQTWAEILSVNRDAKALRASQVLLEHILTRYYPEHFSTCLTQQTTLKGRLRWLGALMAEKSTAHDTTTRSAIECWLEQAHGPSLDADNVVWQSLDEDDVFQSWAKDVLRRDDYQLHLKQAERSAARALRRRYFLSRSGYKASKSELRVWSDLVAQALDAQLGLAACELVIKESIATWLKEDPTNYLALVWHRDAYSRLEHRDILTQARDMELSSTLLKSLAEDLSMLGMKDSLAGRHETAAEDFQLAAALNSTTPQYYQLLADEWRHLDKPDEEIDALRALAALRPEPDVEATLRSRELSRQFDLHYGAKDLRLPVVTPIAIEVSADLLPYLTDASGELTGEFLDHLSRMRDRMLVRYGVKIPGVRFRGSEADHPAGTYIILIDELPMVSGNLDPGVRLFRGTLSGLEDLDITAEETSDPASRQPAYWIQSADWRRVEEAGYALWQLVEYPVRHLEAVVAQNLPAFVGHQQVWNIVMEQAPDYEPRLSGDASTLTALTQVVRALLEEGVPVVEMEAILGVFFSMWDEKLGVSQVLDAIRSLDEIRQSLPGNDASYVLYRLSPNFESLFQEANRFVDEQAVLVMDPKEVQEALTAVREVVASHPHEALVVDKPEIRLSVRELVQLEFPQIPVLSRKELLPELDDRIRGEIVYAQA